MLTLELCYTGILRFYNSCFTLEACTHPAIVYRYHGVVPKYALMAFWRFHRCFHGFVVFLRSFFFFCYFERFHRDFFVFLPAVLTVSLACALCGYLVQDDARRKRLEREKVAREGRQPDTLRSPIVCIMGHVDTGEQGDKRTG